MKIYISKIINQMMAQSAMAAVLNDEKCASLLTPDHESLLRLIVRQECCRFGLSLARYLDDIDLDDDSKDDTLSFVFSDPKADSDPTLAEQLHTLLASATLGSALCSSGIPEGEHFTALADGGLCLFIARLTGLPRPLRSSRY